MADDKEVVLVESSYSFDWNAEEFTKQVSEEATLYADAYKAEEERHGKWVPSAFLNEGKYVFRIYPFRRKKDGAPAIIRRIFTHRLPETRPVLQSDEVVKILENAEKCGVKNLWKMFPREVGLMMVHLYECPVSDYTKPGMDICLRLDPKEIFAIYRFLDEELKPNEKIDLLNPNAENHPITLSISGGGNKKQASAYVNTFGKTVVLPKMKLPEGVEWKGMEEVYLSETSGRITSEELDKFRKHVSGLILDATKSANTVDPASAGSNAGHQFGAVVAGTSSQSSASQSSIDEKCEIVKNFDVDPELKKSFPNARFGKQPGAGSDNAEEKAVQCYLCAHSSDCEKLTLKK